MRARHRGVRALPSAARRPARARRARSRAPRRGAGPCRPDLYPGRVRPQRAATQQTPGGRILHRFFCPDAGASAQRRMCLLAPWTPAGLASSKAGVHRGAPHGTADVHLTRVSLAVVLNPASRTDCVNYPNHNLFLARTCTGACLCTWRRRQARRWCGGWARCCPARRAWCMSRSARTTRSGARW
jgi:hypothetical protein